MRRFEHKIALVTSSTKGIGKACAALMAREGATVYLAVRNEQLAGEVIAEIGEAGGYAKFVYFNAREPESHTAMVKTVIENEGRLDIMVNNYGATDVEKDKDLVGGDTDAFFRILNENIQTVYLPCKEAIPHMIKNGGGSIVNISSIGSVIPDLSRLAYCVSKSSINALTVNIATQYARANVRCNAVLPGLTETNAAMTHMSGQFRDSFLRHVPMNRMGTPEDIANAVAYFASDESSFVTGHILDVAGGFGIPTPQFAEFIG